MSTIETTKNIDEILATELSVKPHQVMAAMRLLDSGSTVPFIARYRKEATGGLSDTHLRMLCDRLEYLRELEKRRLEILQTIQDQGKLTESLNLSIQRAMTKAELEDLYLPFKAKRQSKAQMARDQGLEPLAQELWTHPLSDPVSTASRSLNTDKGILTTDAALAGAREILMEQFSEDAPLMGALRERFWKDGWIVSKKKEGDFSTEEAATYQDYFNFGEAVQKIPSHRMLALLRGRNEKILDVRLQTHGIFDSSSHQNQPDLIYMQAIARRFGIEQKNRPADSWLLETVRQTWKYKIKIRLEVDLMMKLKEKSDEEAIQVFAKNLQNLLLAAPVGPRMTLGLDPGFRTGVKVAVIDKTAQVLNTETIYPHPPQNEWKKSLETLAGLIMQYHIEWIAIGNGTASRETDKLVIELLQKTSPDQGIHKMIVSEAGASVYSASELAARELPNLDVTLRGAVSIARRLQDPLAELVKIDPKSIGVGQYQHDVSQTRLGKMLHHVVEDCVNAVGVDVNTASGALLSYVSGLNARTSENIIRYRNGHGLFKNRLELTRVSEFGPKTFEQCAGFLRIQNGDQPLDSSGVHPESYPVVEKILSRIQKPLDKVLGQKQILTGLRAEDFVDEKFGLPTIQDILQELEKPGRDPRPEFKTAEFRIDVQKPEDLKSGLILEGVVTNVANFGAFVDIGVHQDGLVHVSELADSFVKDPHAIIKTGQLVKVRVLEVDIPRKRISLSMRNSKNAKKSLIHSHHKC